MKNIPHETEWKNFARNVAWLRAHHDLSKEKMAELLGVGVETLDKIESGEMPPELSMEVLFRVQSAFGVHPAEQLGQSLGDSQT